MYLINSFFVFRYLVKVTKNEKISCPVCLLFTEKVNFLLVNKEKKISVKTGFEQKVNKQDREIGVEYLKGVAFQFLATNNRKKDRKDFLPT